MPIWKITSDGPVKVTEPRIEQETLLEENLADWIIADPVLLGEPLFIIGQGVSFPGIEEQLDILALDPQGNVVIIALRHGEVKDSVDLLALRYASYLAKWEFDDFDTQAREFLNKTDDDEFNFYELYEQFCVEAGMDEVPDINTEQRVIVVGSEVKDRFGDVALWLHEHSIDIKVVEVEVYSEQDNILVQPRTIIPLPVSRFNHVGRATNAFSTKKAEVSQPWVSDGRTWHLDRRCSSRTKEMLLRLDAIIRDNVEVDGPKWNQKLYVAYRVGNYNWLAVATHSRVLRLALFVQAGVFAQDSLATQLEVEEFDEATVGDNGDTGSSVLVRSRNESTDRVILTISEDFDLESAAFLDFLREAYEAVPQ